jgi:DNA modification methylase
MKPAELIRRCLSNSAPPEGVVLDPFAGSGSTLVACEVLGLKGRAVELDPVYCDVILRRFADLTGQEPCLVERREGR